LVAGVIVNVGKSGMKKITSYIPEQLAVTASAAAKRKRSSEAALIREAITAYVAAVERPWPKTIGIVSDGSIQSDEIEDWINANWRPE
jgi:hypothetical protein